MSDSLQLRPPSPRSFEDLTALERVPLEILNSIAGYLPPASRALVALSSKTLLQKLGSTQFEGLRQRHLTPKYCYWKAGMRSLTDAEQAREDFLTLLERDITDRVFCHSCQKIHGVEQANSRTFPPYTGTYSYQEWAREAQCKKVYDFHYLHMAVKTHRLGFDKEAQAMIDRFSLRTTTYRDSIAYRKEVCPRIINGRYYERTQNWMLLQSGVGPRGHEAPTVCKPCRHEYSKCITLSENATDSAYQKVTTAGSGSANTELFRCHWCAIEYQVDIKDFYNRGYAVVTTAWKDFGQVVSPFNGIRWRYFDYGGRNWDIEFDTVLGSVKKIFEGDTFDFNDVLTEEAEESLLDVPEDDGCVWAEWW